jgi:pimeloyl-ACP methyl ester carboxylesterase/class 3 adenylate cyclase
MMPRTRYAKSGGVSIAYQVVGEGPRPLVFVPGFVSNVEAWWEQPQLARSMRRLASFSRLVLFDKRGTGLSDPVAEVPSLEQRMIDLQAVMDAAGAERADLFGISEGGPSCLLFAARHPERVRSLALYGTTARFTRAPDFPWGFRPELYPALLEEMERGWGEGSLLELFAPSLAGDPSIRSAWGRFQRASASPAMARAVMEALLEIDVRDVLPEVRVPTLVIHRRDERAIRLGCARQLAEHVPGARLVVLEGTDHFPFFGDSDDLADEIEEFVTGSRAAAEPDRAFAVVLFTDIVDSTGRARALGDRRWRDLLGEFRAAVRKQLARFGGRELDSAGDGFFAAFDLPTQALRCSRALREAVAPLGLRVRTGLHAGECERSEGKLAGMAVHVGARVLGEAAPDEILVSGTLKELVAGSGFSFAERGTRGLKGIPGEWSLYALEA